MICEKCEYSRRLIAGYLYCEKNHHPCGDDYSCDSWKSKKETITNYSIIIHKTPEELAKFITEIADCSECEEMHGFRMCDAAPDKSCEDCWCGWLRDETKT